LLASLIGHGWLNVAEVRGLNSDQFAKLSECGIDLPKNSEPANTYLVRFGPDLNFDEVPLKDPDQALAYELVFSMWVRRRDAHAFNRIYKFGVPIFYDSGTAFLGEPRLADLDRFFGPPQNSGWPGSWRITKGSHADLDTQLLRDREVAQFRSDAPTILLPVLDRPRFFEALESCKSRIAKLEDRDLREKIGGAGFSSQEGIHILEFLIQTRSQMNDGLRRLRRVLTGSRWRRFFEFPRSLRSRLNA
jgi:hypothetical protein